jgi:hypothetical protein
MNLVHFCFWAYLAVRAVLNISAVLLKHPTFGGVFFIFLLAKQVQNLSFCTLLLHISCQTIVAVALAMIKTGHLCNSSGHARWPNKDTGAVVAFPYTDWLLAAAAAMARRRRRSAQACMGSTDSIAETPLDDDDHHHRSLSRRQSHHLKLRLRLDYKSRGLIKNSSLKVSVHSI